MHNLVDKVAFITGGGDGIGLAMADVFARAGMKVVIADIRPAALDNAINQLVMHGDRVHAVQLDVTQRDDYAQAADAAERAFGKIHVLCNNAGVNLFAPLDESTYQDWDWIMNVNLNGVFNGIHTILPRIKAHGEGGHIVNTGSMASFISGPGAGIYTTAKFAVRGLTESLRWSLAPQNIGVSLLCPGLVNSNIIDSAQVRPATLSSSTAQVDPGLLNRLRNLQKAGMNPRVVAQKVLRAIERNDLYIFPHHEFREEMREIFNEVLAALPDADDANQTDPRRLQFEAMRRDLVTRAKGKPH